MVPGLTVSVPLLWHRLQFAFACLRSSSSPVFSASWYLVNGASGAAAASGREGY